MNRFIAAVAQLNRRWKRFSTLPRRLRSRLRSRRQRNKRAYRTGCAHQFVHLTQALVQQDTTISPRLWLVTRGAQPVTEADPIALDQTPLWGLARTQSLEVPKLTCSSIDLAADPEAEEVSAPLPGSAGCWAGEPGGLPPGAALGGPADSLCRRSRPPECAPLLQAKRSDWR